MDKKIHKKMKAHPEVKWSEILRRAIKDYLDKIETPNQISVEELRDQLDNESIELLDNLEVEKEIEYYKKIKEMESERLKRLLKLEQGSDE